MSTDTAFAMGLITSALQMVFVMFSWILTTYFGRRSIYLWGSAGNTVLLIALGVAASVGASNAATQAQASLGLIVSVLLGRHRRNVGYPSQAAHNRYRSRYVLHR
jgi:SP family general alpha glucoside:H+ symporter-like MFS transporter